MKTSLLLIALAGLVFSAPAVERLNMSRIPSAAWGCCNLASFGQPMETYKGYQYAVFYDNQGNVCVARRALPDTLWDTLRVSYVTSTSDGHNTPVMGICPLDGTIHLAFDHHNDPLHYSVSVKNLANQPDSFTWTGSLFGSVQNSSVMPTLNVVTYPHFLKRPDGVLQFITRLNGGSGNADWAMWEYGADSSKWVSLGVFLSQVGTYVWPDGYVDNDRCAYPNGYTYAGNRLHITWCWREDCCRQNANHDLMYAYSDDFGRTWRASNSDSAGATGSNPMKLTTPGIKVWDIPVNRGYINQVCQNVDRKGRIHVVTWHVRDGSADDQGYYPAAGWYFHYWRDSAAVWHRDSVMAIDQRCKLFFDDDDNAFLVTDAGAVHLASAATGWSDWRQVINENIGGGEPTVDFSRWEDSRVLSMLSANLSVLEYSMSDSSWPFIRVEARSVADTSAVADAAVRFYDGGVFLRGAFTDASGNGLVRLPAQSYDLNVSQVGFSAAVATGLSVDAVYPDTEVFRVYLAPQAMVGLRIVPETLVLHQNDSFSLQVMDVYADGSESPGREKLTWISRDTALAGVDSLGRVRTHEQAGETRIVCSSETGFSDSIPVMICRTLFLAPLEDAYVRNGAYASNNYGTEAGLMAKTGSVDYTRRTYLKFGLDTLAGSFVAKAVLRLYLTATDITSFEPVAAYEVADNAWTETGINWNNRPLPGVVLDTAVISPAINRYYEWDLTAWVTAHRGDTATLCLLDTTATAFNAVFASREAAANRPELVVTLAEVTGAGNSSPDGRGLLCAYPNPFNPSIRISVPGLRIGEARIFGPSGRLEKRMDIREGTGVWEAKGMPSGVYLIQVRSGKTIFSRKAVLIR